MNRQLAHNQFISQDLTQTERTMLGFIGKIIGKIVQIILIPFAIATGQTMCYKSRQIMCS